jgi:HEAT repeat protein
MVLAAKLQSMMQATRDEDTLKHIIANLDRPGPSHFYGGYLESLRQAAQQRLQQLRGSKEKSSVLQGGGTASQLKRSRVPIEEWTIDDLRSALAEDRGPDLVRALEEIKKRPGAEYTDLLAKAVDDFDGEMKLIARGLLAQRLVRMTEATLQAKLKDRNAEVRAAAALAIGYKEASLHYELADALADANPLVANNAHLSIVKLLGEDLGPKDGASIPERFEASRRWKRWLDARKTN